MIDSAVVEIITLIANVALALSFAVALIFGTAQVKAAARDRRERLTLEALRNFQTREFAELIHYVTSRDMPRSREELQALPLNDRILFIQVGAANGIARHSRRRAGHQYRPCG